MRVKHMLHLRRFSPKKTIDPAIKFFCSLLEKAPEKTLSGATIMQSMVRAYYWMGPLQ